MYTAKITLHKSDKFIVSDDGLQDDLDRLLAYLRMNGQIMGKEYPMVIGENQVSAFVMLPEVSALDNRFNNKYVTGFLDKVGKENLNVEILGQDISTDFSALAEQKFLILYTTYVSLVPCIRDGENFNPIPLYYLPKTYEDEYYDIISWQTNYQACDNLWMNSSVGEKWANKQLVDVDSALSKEGLEICQKLYHATQIPVYYYLHKYYGKSHQAERQRKCPKCGGEWLLDEPLHDLFDFKCDTCHLLSNIAFNIS